MEKKQLVSGLDSYEIPSQEWTDVSNQPATIQLFSRTTYSSFRCYHSDNLI